MKTLFRPRKSLCLIALVILAMALTSSVAYCGDNHFAHTVSDSIMPFVAFGEASLLAVGGGTGKQEAVQGAKALIATTGLVELLKNTVRERRPDSNSRDSFPSGHTAIAFATATLISESHPKWEIPAYGAAALIGWSRVDAREHRWRDVIAGALLGHFVAKRFTKNHFGITPSGIGFQTSW